MLTRLVEFLLASGVLPWPPHDGIPLRVARRHSALLHYRARRSRHG